MSAEKDTGTENLKKEYQAKWKAKIKHIIEKFKILKTKRKV